MDFAKLAGPGLGFVGDLLGAYESQEIAEDNRTLQREQQARNEALQREFAQHGIQWRVEDAKAAGLHPVFALSGGGAAYSPTSVIGDVPEARYGKALSNMGQNITRAQMATMTPEQRLEQELRLQLLRSQIDETDARAFATWSEAFKQPSGPGMPSLLDADDYESLGKGVLDVVKPKPDEVVSSRADNRSITAGRRHPLWQEYQFTKDGRKILLPRSDDPGETLSDMNPLMMLLLGGFNLNHYYGDDIRSMLDMLRAPLSGLGRLTENAVRGFHSEADRRARSGNARKYMPVR